MPQEAGQGCVGGVDLPVAEVFANCLDGLLAVVVDLEAARSVRERIVHKFGAQRANQQHIRVLREGGLQRGEQRLPRPSISDSFRPSMKMGRRF